MIELRAFMRGSGTAEKVEGGVEVMVDVSEPTAKPAGKDGSRQAKPHEYRDTIEKWEASGASTANAQTEQTLTRVNGASTDIPSSSSLERSPKIFRSGEFLKMLG
jgi:hypothetical protein